MSDETPMTDDITKSDVEKASTAPALAPFLEEKSEITDKEALRAFVEPSLYPFLAEIYREKIGGLELLKADLVRAREAYKMIVAEEKKPRRTYEKKNRSRTYKREVPKDR